MQILVLHAGSGSIRHDLYQMPAERRLAGGSLDWHESQDGVEATVDDLIDQLGDTTRALSAVGHRVTHGGAYLVRSVEVDDAIEAEIEACNASAQPYNALNLRAIRTARKRLPGVPHVAVFETAFHASLPPHAFLYGLPYELYTDHGIRRFGFHGPSHQYMALRAVEALGGDPTRTRIITCHLGNGASIAAIAGGASIDTSMGLTPLEGLVMATRPGDLDPAIPGLLRTRGYTARQIAGLLDHHAGLSGLSGLGPEVRDIEAAAARGHARARLAIDVFVYRLRKYIGAYAAALGGVDALVFTGGIGEGSAQIRAGACAGLGFMGIVLDPERNVAVEPAHLAAAGGLAELSTPGAPARVFVLHTEEERMIARDVAACIDRRVAV